MRLLRNSAWKTFNTIYYDSIVSVKAYLASSFEFRNSLYMCHLKVLDTAGVAHQNHRGQDINEVVDFPFLPDHVLSPKLSV
jgi:hypothetical protein